MPESTPKKRASGPSGATQPETARKAKQRLLRLTPAVNAALDERAAAKGLSASAYVSALVMADAAGE
ncbi:MAG TPA: hypothetical protein VFN70_18055 [Burkholderiales bacterium]|nr:hypothetical protein [Burkholderiales bacterium]